MVFDGGIKNLISAAYEQEYDVFLRMPFPALADIPADGVRTAVFLPGAFGGFSRMPFSDAAKGFEKDGLNNTDVIIADIRFLADENFAEILSRGGYSRFIVPFAECADEGEYGYRESYGWIGEYKAQTDSFCQTIAFISASYPDSENMRSIFACDKVISVGNVILPSPRIYKASSSEAKFYQTAAEAEKYACEKVCVFFNSRNEAIHFGRFLSKRGTKHYRFDGSLSSDEKREVLDSFYKSNDGILLATKSLIHEGVFRHFSRCIICGAPFSLSHLERCSACAPESSALVIYCDSDFERNDRISLSFASIAENENIYNKRQNRLLEIKNFLERGK